MYRKEFSKKAIPAAIVVAVIDWALLEYWIKWSDMSGLFLKVILFLLVIGYGGYWGTEAYKKYVSKNEFEKLLEKMAEKPENIEKEKITDSLK